VGIFTSEDKRLLKVVRQAFYPGREGSYSGLPSHRSCDFGFMLKKAAFCPERGPIDAGRPVSVQRLLQGQAASGRLDFVADCCNGNASDTNDCHGQNDPINGHCAGFVFREGSHQIFEEVHVMSLSWGLLRLIRQLAFFEATSVSLLLVFGKDI
jgi:hypothetical protein